MAKAISTDHNMPDVRDEGKIKRYGFVIATIVLVLLMSLFVAWATYTGLLNQQQDRQQDRQQNQSSAQP